MKPGGAPEDTDVSGQPADDATRIEATPIDPGRNFGGATTFDPPPGFGPAVNSGLLPLPPVPDRDTSQSRIATEAPPPEDATVVQVGAPIRYMQADTAIHPAAQTPQQSWKDADSYTQTRAAPDHPGATRSASPLPLAPLPFSDLLPGAVLGARQIVAQIGEGPLGVTYSARHQATGELCAIKVLHAAVAPDAEAVAKVMEENRALAALRHKSILPLAETEELADGRRYFVMEHLPGRSVADLLAERRGLSIPEVIGLLRPIASALDAAHAAGIVHRSLKPTEVLLAQGHEGRVVRVGGFGLGRLLVRPDGTMARNRGGAPLASPYYLAPEQCRALPLDPRADVYALGVMLYECLSGQLPFAGTSPLDVLQAHLSAAPMRLDGVNPETPAWLSDLVLRALEKNPADRPASAGAVLRTIEEDIRRGAREGGGAVAPGGFPTRVVAGAALLVAAAAAALLLAR